MSIVTAIGFALLAVAAVAPVAATTGVFVGASVAVTWGRRWR